MQTIKYKIARFIYRILGDDYGGSHSPPGVNCRLEFGEPEEGKYPYLATTYNNDGFELWLEWGGKWAAFYSAKQARKLAWFILWDWWIVSTWCGLKRWIWYKALHYIVKVKI